MYNAACCLSCSWIWFLARFSISLSFCPIRPFVLSTYNPMHHSICIHSSLISFSVHKSCGLFMQRPALGQIRIMLIFVQLSRSSANSARSCCLHHPQRSLCSCDYHSYRCGLRKYRCLINTDLTAYLTQSPNRRHNHWAVRGPLSTSTVQNH